MAMIDDSHSLARSLVERPTESLSTEIKSWLDLDQKEHKATLVKALLALFNHNGGQLIIGFADKTLAPVKLPSEDEVRKQYHSDRVNSLVSKYASQPIDIHVEFVERESQTHPVIFVSSGVRTPAATRAEIKGDGKEKPILPLHAVFVRTQLANHTPSTSQFKYGDLGALLERCFENREADIGRFIRRHLSGLTQVDRDQLAVLVGVVGGNPVEAARALLDDGEMRFDTLIAKRGYKPLDLGTWSVACVQLGHTSEHEANAEFLDLLRAADPRYTGWPPWLDSRGFAEASTRPFVADEMWHALLSQTDRVKHFDYQLWDPKGRFYLRRYLEDDVQPADRGPAPREVLDFSLTIIRCAEAVATCAAFARAMGCDPEKTELAFAFRWTGLSGRLLRSWTQPRRPLYGYDKSAQDEITVTFSMYLSTPESAIGSLLVAPLGKVFQLFSGMKFQPQVVEEIANQLLERRLRG